MSFFYTLNAPNLLKKARPPPRDIVVMNMNYQII